MLILSNAVHKSISSHFSTATVTFSCTSWLLCTSFSTLSKVVMLCPHAELSKLQILHLATISATAPQVRSCKI